MVQPINYMGMIPRQDFGKRFLEGLQIGGALGELSQAEKQRTDAAALKVQYATDFEKLLRDPSMKAFNEFALTYPTQREVIKDVAGRFTQDQLDSEFDSGAQVAVALENQNPDVALNILNKTIAARKQSNLPTTTQDQIQAILANTEDPDRVPKAQRLTNFALTLLNPEKFGKVVGTLEAQEMRPERVKEQTAKAQKSAIDADFATAEAVQSLNLKAEQIENYASQREIARANLKINALNAELTREGNVLKREELQQKLTFAREERDTKVREKRAEAMSVLADSDNALNTADRLLANYGKDKKGNIDPTKPNFTASRSTGPVVSQFLTISQGTADFQALIATMESQAFLSQVNKLRGLGALSDKEGGRLNAALGNLSLTQSPEQLGRNVLEIQRLIMKMRMDIEQKFGVSVTPDRPALGVPAPATVPSAMGTATDRAVTPGMPSGFRVLRD